LIVKNKEENKDSETMSCKQNISESAHLKNKALHSALKMNEQQKEWFENIEGFPCSKYEHQQVPPYLRRNQSKPSSPEVPTSQKVFNINGNWYENLLDHQTLCNPYSPNLSTYYKIECNKDETIDLAPSFPPLGNLYENIMDFMETTIEQYVCQRSHHSPFRQAAQTLARSKLNPNAKEFTPMTKPRDVIESDEEMEIRKYSESIRHSADFEHQERITKEVRVEKKEETSPPVEGEIIKKDTKNFSKLAQTKVSDETFCDSNISVCENNSGDDGMDDDYEEYDSDWDSDEQSLGQCVEIDPSQFEDLFPSPLMISNLRVCTTKSSNNLSVCPAHDFQSTQPIRAISQINIEPFGLCSSQILCKNSGRSVKFSDDVNVVEEPEDLANDLHTARLSDFPARQADKERRERLLAPILTNKHRRKMYQKIYGDS